MVGRHTTTADAKGVETLWDVMRMDTRTSAYTLETHPIAIHFSKTQSIIDVALEEAPPRLHSRSQRKLRSNLRTRMIYIYDYQQIQQSLVLFHVLIRQHCLKVQVLQGGSSMDLDFSCQGPSRKALTPSNLSIKPPPHPA